MDAQRKNASLSTGALAKVIDSTLTELLGSSAAKALNFHVARMARAYDATTLAIEDPAMFEEATTQLFGEGGVALLDKLATHLFWSIIPRTRSGSFDYAVSGRYHEKILQLRNIHIMKNTILEMKDRDHIAATYSSPFQIEQMIYHFVVRGLQNNQMTLVVVSRSEERAFVEFLKVNGMDVNRLVECQEIVIVLHDELYPDNLDSSFEPILARLHAARGIMESRKKTGLNVIGTVAGNLALSGDREKCIRLERAWHELIPDYPVPITLFCPYPAGTITADSKAPLAECHSRGVHLYA